MDTNLDTCMLWTTVLGSRSTLALLLLLLIPLSASDTPAATDCPTRCTVCRALISEAVVAIASEPSHASWGLHTPPTPGAVQLLVTGIGRVVTIIVSLFRGVSSMGQPTRRDCGWPIAHEPLEADYLERVINAVMVDRSADDDPLAKWIMEGILFATKAEELDASAAVARSVVRNVLMLYDWRPQTRQLMPVGRRIDHSQAIPWNSVVLVSVLREAGLVNLEDPSVAHFDDDTCFYDVPYTPQSVRLILSISMWRWARSAPPPRPALQDESAVWRRTVYRDTLGVMINSTCGEMCDRGLPDSCYDAVFHNSEEVTIDGSDDDQQRYRRAIELILAMAIPAISP